MFRGSNPRHYFRQQIQTRDVIVKQPSKKYFDSVCINISPDKLWNSMSYSPKTDSLSWDPHTCNWKRKGEIIFYVEFFIILVAISFIFVIFVLHREGLLPIWFPNMHYLMGLPIIFIFFSLIMILIRTTYFPTRVMKCRWNTLSHLAHMP
ncbi:hypothetical protein TNIN_95861 [Trichonephila inaurata madagascariensis]|uniref:Uncharacterized protein n=1 Tax=Trichonephila inaurata madagascariensis TaxID=2747483 RepID=A0A8X6X7C1_9ARAC|nr:hypothetical protein TNIN_95861 [Trichonephila inaurata madagascariensis]